MSGQTPVTWGYLRAGVLVLDCSAVCCLLSAPGLLRKSCDAGPDPTAQASHTVFGLGPTSSSRDTDTTPNSSIQSTLCPDLGITGAQKCEYAALARKGSEGPAGFVDKLGWRRDT
ncbi:unnamed protein product [Diplocarpon coronariae]|nr:hypothetical protein JHW43_009622 [Diplocarpon mali]